MGTRRYKEPAQPCILVEGLVPDTWVPGRLGEHLGHITTVCGSVACQHKIRISSRRIGDKGKAEMLGALLRALGYQKIEIST